jgi:hypothetical protein
MLQTLAATSTTTEGSWIFLFQVTDFTVFGLRRTHVPQSSRELLSSCSGNRISWEQCLFQWISNIFECWKSESSFHHCIHLLTIKLLLRNLTANKIYNSTCTQITFSTKAYWCANTMQPSTDESLHVLWRGHEVIRALTDVKTLSIRHVTTREVIGAYSPIILDDLCSQVIAPRLWRIVCSQLETLCVRKICS